jgi:hypothetical protein
VAGLGLASHSGARPPTTLQYSRVVLRSTKSTRCVRSPRLVTTGPTGRSRPVTPAALTPALVLQRPGAHRQYPTSCPAFTSRRSGRETIHQLTPMMLDVLEEGR